MRVQEIYMKRLGFHYCGTLRCMEMSVMAKTGIAKTVMAKKVMAKTEEEELELGEEVASGRRCACK